MKIMNFQRKKMILITNRGAAHSLCNLKYSISNKIAALFHNGSNYDYHLTIRELAKEFEGENLID